MTPKRRGNSQTQTAPMWIDGVAIVKKKVGQGYPLRGDKKQKRKKKVRGADKEKEKRKGEEKGSDPGRSRPKERIDGVRATQTTIDQFRERSDSRKRKPDSPTCENVSQRPRHDK